MLIQAGALVNGTTIRRETAGPERFTYYHVELADHALILAEGAPAETFIDNVDRLAFDNWEEHEALYPDGKEMAELELPRAKSHRQVPMATRARLARRAAHLAPGPLPPDKPRPTISILSDGTVARPPRAGGTPPSAGFRGRLAACSGSEASNTLRRRMYPAYGFRRAMAKFITGYSACFHHLSRFIQITELSV